MGKRIGLIIAIVVVALVLTGNSVGWLQRGELSRRDYFASFAESYREQGKTDDGNTKIVISAPDFSRLSQESDIPLADMTVNDLQVLVSAHPAMKTNYEFTVAEVSREAICEGFFYELSLGILNQTAQTADISGRWSDRKQEADTAVFAEEIPVSISASGEKADQKLKEYLGWYRDGKAENLLLLPDNYSYWKLAEALDPDRAWDSCYQAIRDLTGEEPEEPDYYQVLLEELILMDLDESKTDYAAGLTFDNLSRLSDLGFDKEEMKDRLVEDLAAKSPGMGELQDQIELAASRIASGTDNAWQWSECIAGFSVMVENYADFDNLLLTLSQNSDGALHDQAEALRQSARQAMSVQLSTYQDFTNATRSDYDVRWFDAVFFAAARADDSYRTKEDYRTMVDDLEDLFAKVSIRQGMKKNIAALVHLPGPDLTECMWAAEDLRAQADIDRILQKALVTLIGRVEEETAAGSLRQADGDAYVNYSKYLLFGRMRGEYLTYGLVKSGEDMREWFRDRVGTDVRSWYDEKSGNLANMRSDLLKLHDSEQETYEGHGYLVVDDGMTWTEARAFCESMGGHLVSINSKGEQKFLQSLIAGGGRSQYWIGGMAKENGSGQADGTADGKKGCRWITGEEFSYSNWDVNEPGGSGLTAGGSYMQILRLPDPSEPESKKYHWKLAPEDNTYQISKPEIVRQAEEAKAAAGQDDDRETEGSASETDGSRWHWWMGLPDDADAVIRIPTGGTGTADGTDGNAAGDNAAEGQAAEGQTTEGQAGQTGPDAGGQTAGAAGDGGKVGTGAALTLPKYNPTELEQAASYEAALKKYRAQQKTVSFYGLDHVGFICEWD